MAEYKGLITTTLVADADLSGKQYHFVRYVAGKKMNQASQAAHTGNFGVLLTKPRETEHGTVAYGGECKVVAGASITDGVFVTTNGSGRAAAVTSGQIVMGKALESTTGDGNIITVLLMPVDGRLTTA